MNDLLQLRPGSVEWREIDGELVGLQTADSTYFSVNPSGTILWRRLADGTTREGLVDALRDSYALDPEVAQRDVERFLEAVSACGLLDG
jgi:Coenzyme PQQ synthesis protein D (PqqD)